MASNKASARRNRPRREFRQKRFFEGFPVWRIMWTRLTKRCGLCIVVLGNRIFMGLCQKFLCPWLRSVAAVTLLSWVAAAILCTAHCSIGISSDDSQQASCHASASPHHDEDHSPAPAHDDSSASAACLTLKSAMANGDAPAPVHPDFHLFYILAPLKFALDVTTTEPATLVLRQARLREFVLTPEMCLGPAFRSHAPPALL